MFKRICSGIKLFEAWKMLLGLVYLKYINTFSKMQKVYLKQTITHKKVDTTTQYWLEEISYAKFFITGFSTTILNHQWNLGVSLQSKKLKNQDNGFHQKMNANHHWSILSRAFRLNKTKQLNKKNSFWLILVPTSTLVTEKL